eukprot:10344089-Alexandrium_andersonii.AAC.1
MAIFLKVQSPEVQRRAMSLIQNNKVYDTCERDLDVSTEVKLGEQEVDKGMRRPTDAEYGAYITALFNLSLIHI